MKIFLSWSESRSSSLALIVKDLLIHTFNSMEPFMSAVDIMPGEPWLERITTELRGAEVGVLCITQENLSAPWIHLETGAMFSRRILVIPYCLDFKPSQLPSTLNQFNGVQASYDGTLSLLRAVNSVQKQSLTNSVLEIAFKTYWEETMKSQLADIPSHSVEKRIVLSDEKTEQIMTLALESSVFRVVSAVDNFLYRLPFEQDSFKWKDLFKTLYDSILDSRRLCAGFHNEKIGAIETYFDMKFQEADLKEEFDRMKPWVMSDDNQSEKLTHILNHTKSVIERIFKTVHVDIYNKKN